MRRATSSPASATRAIASSGRADDDVPELGRHHDAGPLRRVGAPRVPSRARRDAVRRHDRATVRSDGRARWPAQPLAIGFTVFWIVGMNNALNFIDGLDGLAAGVAGIAAVALGATALLPSVNEPFVAWMNFTLAGAIAGFLVFNVHPAKVFLGTTGVAFVGPMLAVL